MPSENGVTFKWTTGILVLMVFALVGAWTASIRSSDAQLTARLEQLDLKKATKEDLLSTKAEMSLMDVRMIAMDGKKADRIQVDEINRRLISIEGDIKELLRRK